MLASSNYLRVPILMEYDELKKLQINAATDPLTELYNRRFFEDQYQKELNRALRYNHHLAIVVLDLHQFKDVNDRYGHPRGDALLRTVAATLRKSLRTSDYAFRIGGDEFALLLVQSDMEQATTLARRVRANFAAAAEPMQLGVALGLDYGLAVYPDDGDQKEALIRVADERLYEMKRDATSQPQPGPAQRTSSPAEPAIPAMPSWKAPPVGAKSSFTGTERRKWERVPLAETRAYAQLAADPKKTARVLDLSYGGLALEMGASEDLGPTFHAVLHVPILPPVRVSLRPLYNLRGASGLIRVGCAFIT